MLFLMQFHEEICWLGHYMRHLSFRGPKKFSRGPKVIHKVSAGIFKRWALRWAHIHGPVSSQSERARFFEKTVSSSTFWILLLYIKTGLYCWENDFVVFQKTDSLSACGILLRKQKKDPKWHGFERLNIVLRASSNVQNQFGMDSKVRRTHFEHYFEYFVTKVLIRHFYCTVFTKASQRAFEKP